MKNIGFLSFGHWSASPHSRVRSGADALPAYAALPRPLAECALRPTGEERDGWLAWNLGRSRLDAFLDASGGVWQHRTDCPGQTRSD